MQAQITLKWFNLHRNSRPVSKCFNVATEDEALELFVDMCKSNSRKFTDIIDEMADKGGGGAFPFSLNKVKKVCKDKRGWCFEDKDECVRITLRIG